VFILTDGKNYVMENPMKIGEYISTTSPIHATEFSYKQANSLRQRKGKKYTWMHNYQLVNVETGKNSKISPNYEGNGKAYIGENDIKFDESILDKIFDESNLILGLAGWDINQLQTYYNILEAACSKYDSAESDVGHALQKYREANLGKRPQAHQMAKIGYLLDEIRDKHKRIKQCMRNVSVMKDAITYKYDIGKLKLELSKVNCGEYKGRTEFYDKALKILS